ncbi:uncharacterized protein LOC125541125 [Triticum urartu]|uniref:uncharacterized protein LOC125541125 n=1 Tax=Triticum urartu TaxID=4572 RepID=UPI0020449820|nr:uncharacterized protein LOC125541125 [Triticum urartu]
MCLHRTLLLASPCLLARSKLSFGGEQTDESIQDSMQKTFPSVLESECRSEEQDAFLVDELVRIDWEATTIRFLSFGLVMNALLGCSYSDRYMLRWRKEFGVSMILEAITLTYSNAAIVAIFA